MYLLLFTNAAVQSYLVSIVTLVFVLYCNVFSMLYTAYSYSVFVCAVAQLPTLEAFVAHTI